MHHDEISVTHLIKPRTQLDKNTAHKKDCHTIAVFANLGSFDFVHEEYLVQPTPSQLLPFQPTSQSVKPTITTTPQHS